MDLLRCLQTVAAEVGIRSLALVAVRLAATPAVVYSAVGAAAPIVMIIPMAAVTIGAIIASHPAPFAVASTCSYQDAAVDIRAAALARGRPIRHFSSSLDLARTTNATATLSENE